MVGIFLVLNLLFPHAVTSLRCLCRGLPSGCVRIISSAWSRLRWGLVCTLATPSVVHRPAASPGSLLEVQTPRALPWTHCIRVCGVTEPSGDSFAHLPLRNTDLGDFPLEKKMI